MPFQPDRSTYVPFFGESTHSWSFALVECARFQSPRLPFSLLHCFSIVARVTSFFVSPFAMCASRRVNFCAPPMSRACLLMNGLMGEDRLTEGLAFAFFVPESCFARFRVGLADAVA